MQKYLILVAGVLIIAAIMFGCDDRGTGITPSDMGDLENWALAPLDGHVFQPALTLQLRNSTEQLLNSMYVPPEGQKPEPDPLPLLVLLAPETGSQYYYFESGLGELIRELTASGQIKPMIVYCVASDQTFGGYFYGNSDPAGRYDSIFNSDGVDYLSGRDDILEFVHRETNGATIDMPSKRGIGGIGQGAYGAFRVAIKNPGLFSSISVADGPLDFDGADGNSGLIGLFQSALEEEKNYYYHSAPTVDTISDSVIVPGRNYDYVKIDTTIVDGVIVTIDTTWIDYDTVPFNYYRDFDTSLTMPLAMMLMGGSLAFSPNDTLITYNRIAMDSINLYRVENVVQYQLVDSTGGDSTTLIRNVIRKGSTSHNLEMDFHLPFDSNGAVYTPIWNRWMDNNLQNMYMAQGDQPLNGMKMFIATNPNARWNYYAMTQSWISFLGSQGLDTLITEYPYSSYNENPVVHDEYLFDLLRQMLIFHSNNFNK